MITVNNPPSNLVACRNVHISYLCERMRPDEIEQYLALTGNKEFDSDVAARGFMTIPGLKFTILDDKGMPAAAGGFEPIGRGVYQSWMLGCMDGWENAWRSITKGARWMMDGLLEGDARRLQTTALASRTKTIEWYEQSLGLVREGTLRQFGANGEDAAIFARVREVALG